MSKFMFPVCAGAKHDRLADEPAELFIRDVIKAPRPDAKIIVVASASRGVGKSTIAFQLIVALADAGLRVAAVDLDLRYQTLHNGLARRDMIACLLDINLPVARHQLVHCGERAMFCDELREIGRDSDVIVIDVTEMDTAIGKRALAMADIVLTPVDGAPAGLDNPERPGRSAPEMTIFGGCARSVKETRHVRQLYGLPPFDWVVMQNRVRRPGGHDHGRIETDLKALASTLGFGLGPSLGNRAAYRDLFQFGLTQLDLHKIPSLPPAGVHITQEIRAMLAAITAKGSDDCDIPDKLAALPMLISASRSTGLLAFFHQ